MSINLLPFCSLFIGYICRFLFLSSFPVCIPFLIFCMCMYYSFLGVLVIMRLIFNNIYVSVCMIILS